MPHKRFYFPLDAAADVSPAISASDWAHINEVRRKLLDTPDGSTFASLAYPTESHHITNINTHHRQYVSGPLAAQTISGTVKAQIFCNESGEFNNQFLTIKVWVCSNEGSTQRGVLLAVQRDDVEMQAFGGASGSNRRFGPYNLNELAIQDGDRLVVEVGSGGLPVDNVGTQNHQAWVRWGAAGTGDIPDDPDGTWTYQTSGGSPNGNHLRSWIEFSGTVAPQVPVGGSQRACGISVSV